MKDSNVNETNLLIKKAIMKASENYRKLGGNMRDVLKGDMKAKVKDFNVNEINKSQINRKKLLSLLTKDEQQMFKTFVKSLQS